MAAPSCIDNEVKSLAFSFSDFFSRDYDVFRERDVITEGFPKNQGFPAISCTISCRNVRYDTLNE